MSIIRSNIARQLLAEGGAPRKPFSKGGFDDYEGDAYGTTSMSDYESGTAGDPMGEAAGTSDMFSGGGGSPFIEASEVAITGGPRGRQDLDSQFDSMQGYMAPKQTVLGGLRDNAGDIFLGLTAPQLLIAKKAAERFGLVDRNYVPDKDRFNREEDDDSDPIILPKLRAPIEEKEPELTDFQQMLARAGARFEDGGDVRQNYGLGSIVKKAFKTVKKVAKSPVGKAALLAAATVPFGGPLAVAAKAKPFFLGTTLGDTDMTGNQGILKALGLIKGGYGQFDGLTTLGKFATLGIPTAASFFMTPKQEDEDETLPAAVRSDPEMKAVIDYYGQKFAQGGEVEDEMLDLGGKEMDLRGGGFVPLGEYEKKDDVPARLSKNEFVFTADAVRAAGGGSVDKGADVMYKTMKTLENKVA
jgi:hypothetical protein